MPLQWGGGGGGAPKMFLCPLPPNFGQKRPQKARNRNKAIFATKLRKLSKDQLCAPCRDGRDGEKRGREGGQRSLGKVLKNFNFLEPFP